MKNYTSQVPAERSVAEIEALLIRAGARSIQKEYSPSGEIAAVNFVILCPETNAPIGVRLPADQEAVFQVFRKQRKAGAFRAGWEKRMREQAKRTAWRLTLDWVAVQLSMIEMRQAELMQVFLPYLWAGKGTFYQSLKESKFAALGYSGKAEATEDE